MQGLCNNGQGKVQHHLGTAQKPRLAPHDFAVQHVGKLTNDATAETVALCGATWPHAVIRNHKHSILVHWIVMECDLDDACLPADERVTQRVDYKFRPRKQ
jgi:hypothetical protein